MVAMGFKIDYCKDMVFNLFNLGWMMWGQCTLLTVHFELAHELDQPIRCVFNSSTPVGLEIRAHCDLVGEEYFIPHSTFKSERFWSDFLGINGCIGFGSWSFLVLLLMTPLYCKIYSAENEEFRHILQTVLDQIRAMYMYMISILSLNFLFIYVRVLNKLTAFGAWQHVSATSEVQQQLAQGVELASDSDRWDMTTLLPDLSSLVRWEAPSRDAEQYLGEFFHKFFVFCLLTLTKNAFFCVVTSLTDDLHIVSLFFAAIPATLFLLLFWWPYIAALYMFKNIDLHFAKQFNFDFGHTQQTALYGGLMFGILALPTLFQHVMQACTATALRYELWLLKKRAENSGFEPGLFNREYFQILAFDMWNQRKSFASGSALAGIIGLSCLGWCANEVDQDYVREPFMFILVIWVVVQCLSCLLVFRQDPPTTPEDMPIVHRPDWLPEQLKPNWMDKLTVEQAGVQAAMASRFRVAPL